MPARGRTLLADASTPAYRTVCKRGAGTDDPRRMSSERRVRARVCSVQLASRARLAREPLRLAIRRLETIVCRSRLRCGAEEATTRFVGSTEDLPR